jgi:hypothetical protein
LDVFEFISIHFGEGFVKVRIAIMGHILGYNFSISGAIIDREGIFD